MNGLDGYGEVFLNEVILPVIKGFYRLTQQPLISVGDEIYNNSTELTSLLLVIGIDEDHHVLDLQDFLTKFFSKIGILITDTKVQQIQIGSCIAITEIFRKFISSDKILRVKMICKSLTQKLLEELAQMKIFFMFMGTIESLKQQQARAEIRLNPQHNRIYGPDHNYWKGTLCDGKDRGNQPYYCPVGWKRSSLYVSGNFYRKFKGWCICYHGTRFVHGLSILLSGLMAAKDQAHGPGIYTSPSIIYASHPRYAEIKLVESSVENDFFEKGQYIQFVLECRVHPNNIKKIGCETLRVRNRAIIDANISNDSIEWLIDTHGKDLMDFNDPNSVIVCTGIMIRVTDNHPGLLPVSEWWYTDGTLDYLKSTPLGIPYEDLIKKRKNKEKCNIIFK
ncbi:unnamed protein product [Rotaria sordida]|uniref:Uncharacterized protein n=1 Tax=Rotaria sordida TaxID=392033 RepID=A0A814TLR1_9BILA|nr:unnamed protein product [Rotaria sordida]CAF1414861.1 unnamed protein product [Rotaria sordida]